MQLRLVHSTAAPAGKSHIAPFVFSDLTFDIPAIKAAAKARYAGKLAFVDRFTGAPRRYWRWNISRRVIREMWAEAREQRHRIVWSRLPSPLPYYAHERARLALLSSRMATAPVTARGNADYKAAAGEYGQIVANAQRRAYRAIIEQARAS